MLQTFEATRSISTRSRPDGMRPRPDTMRPRLKNLASRPHRPQRLNIHGFLQILKTKSELLSFTSKILLHLSHNKMISVIPQPFISPNCISSISIRCQILYLKMLSATFIVCSNNLIPLPTRRRSESAYIRQVHGNVMMYTSTHLHKHLPSNVLAP